MNQGERSHRIKTLAGQLGFDRCGIAAAAPIPRGDFFREWLASGHAGTMGYLHRHVESRIDLRRWLPAANSVVVVALNYKQTVTPKPADQPRGKTAMYAWGEDYHVVVREKLERLASQLRDEWGQPFEYRICVDTSAITERELAAMAGIGWIGKNTLVLHQQLGSFFVLGEMICDLELTPDAPETDHCGTCTRCLDACPTQAFPKAYEMDARKCISYLTIEHRGVIDPALASKLGDWVFGCDVCQEVCPFNREAPEMREPRFQASDAVAFPVLNDILGWDEELYASHVNGRAADRARRMMWKRNAEIALRNTAEHAEEPSP